MSAAPWTPQEEQQLRSLVGLYPPAEIAEHLGRSLIAVNVRIQVLDLSALPSRPRTLTPPEIAKLLGVTCSTVQRWLREGVLVGRRWRRQQGRGGRVPTHLVWESEVRRFVTEHPERLRLDRVPSGPWRRLLAQYWTEEKRRQYLCDCKRPKASGYLTALELAESAGMDPRMVYYGMRSGRFPISARGERDVALFRVRDLLPASGLVPSWNDTSRSAPLCLTCRRAMLVAPEGVIPRGNGFRRPHEPGRPKRWSTTYYTWRSRRQQTQCDPCRQEARTLGGQG